MNNIDELKANVRRIKQDLYAAESALKAAQVAVAEFQVDDIVLAGGKHGKPWREAVVRRVDVRYGTFVDYDVAYRNKGGEWSKATHRTWAGIKALGK